MVAKGVYTSGSISETGSYRYNFCSTLIVMELRLKNSLPPRPLRRPTSAILDDLELILKQKGDKTSFSAKKDFSKCGKHEPGKTVTKKFFEVQLRSESRLSEPWIFRSFDKLCTRNVKAFSTRAFGARYDGFSIIWTKVSYEIRIHFLSLFGVRLRGWRFWGDWI